MIQFVGKDSFIHSTFLNKAGHGAVGCEIMVAEFCLPPASSCLCTTRNVACVIILKFDCSWEFHQIYTLGALGDKDELIKF